MRRHLHITLAVLGLVLTGHAASAAEADEDRVCVINPDNCGPATDDTISIVITSSVQVFDAEGLDNGAAAVVQCTPSEVRLIREANVIGAPAGDYRYAGNQCVPANSVAEGVQTIATPDLVADVDFPAVVVNHNPHADFFIANIPVWFWHTGPTELTAPITVELANGGAITGTYRGRITRWCWTVDDPRGPLPDRTDAVTTGCTEPAGATTYTSTSPGEDSEDGAAATHTYTTRGYDSTITHTAVWDGTVTIDSAPVGLLTPGLVLDLAPTHVRAQTTVPVRQVIPAPVPAGRP